jgi:hypothetical protein
MKCKAKYKREKWDFDRGAWGWLKRYVSKNTCRKWKRMNQKQGHNNETCKKSALA